CDVLLDRAANHQFLGLADGLGWVQALRTDVNTVHDRVAAERARRILDVVQASAGGLVPPVCLDTVRLQQAGRALDLVGVRSERRAGRRAAGAQNALVQAVELFAGLGRLQAFVLGRRRVIDEIRPY